MRTTLTAGALALALAGGSPLRAQDPPAADPPRPARVVPASAAPDDRLRAAQLLGDAPAEASLLRSVSGTVLREGAPLVSVGPDARLVYNSRIPFSLNDGALWAGRGVSTHLRAGFAARAGVLLVVLAPELVSAENRELGGVVPAGWDSAGVGFIPPWQRGRNSIDLPYRAGGGPIRRIEPGQSTLAIVAGKLVAGASTESQWWGPGHRNALVLSENAAGVPHLFAATAAPVRTPLGRVEGRWMAGALAASEYLDAPGGRRSLSAAAVTLRPGRARGLTLGAARAVYAPVSSWGDVPARALDVLARAGSRGDTVGTSGSEQVMSLFARWVLPGEGVEVYGEWGRRELPSSPRDLLLAPEHTQGYTLGAGWAGRAGRGALTLRGEMTYLEESSTYRVRPTGSWYASPSLPHGYTHRGQVLGAAIGPGASSQWAAAEWLGPGARAGLFAGRIRWSNDAYMDTEGSRLSRYRGHDVTVFGGARAGAVAGGFELTAEWTLAKRFNYLFQSRSGGWSDRDNTVNVMNHTLQLQLRPLAHRR